MVIVALKNSCLIQREAANYAMNPIRTGSLIDAIAVKISVRNATNKLINYIIMVCVGGVIFNVIDVTSHVSQNLYYAIIVIVVNRINHIVNPIVLLILFITMTIIA